MGKQVSRSSDRGRESAPRASAGSAEADSRERELRLESLRLSRSRLLDQLERARYSAHREVLQNGLRAIEKEIEELTRRALIS